MSKEDDGWLPLEHDNGSRQDTCYICGISPKDEEPIWVSPHHTTLNNKEVVND